MLIEAIWIRPVIRVLREMLRGGEFTYYSASELAERTELSVPTVIEALNNLMALGIIHKVKVTKKRFYFKITQLNPLLPLIQEILDIAAKLENKIVEEPLTHIDRVLGDDYYVGMYWAAMANITPIDYAPRIYAIYTKKPQWILPLKVSDKIYAEIEEKWQPEQNKEVYLAIIPTKEFPYDLTIGNIQGEKVRVASIERGIAQTFKTKIYPPYAATLALIQNKDMNRINERKLEQIAAEERTLPIIKAVAYVAEQKLGQKIFERLSKDVKTASEKPQISWGKKPTLTLKVGNTIVAIDTRPIEEAITTVYG